MIGAWIVVVLVLLVAVLALYTWLTQWQAQKRVPPNGQFVEVEGARLHYVDRGNGPAIVMVHGLGGNLHNFYALVDQLAETYRVVVVDRPGSGYSKSLSGEQPALRAQATIIARFIEKLGLERPLLVGHSLGGALSLALALDHPERIRALLLLSPASQVERVPPGAFKVLFIRSPFVRRLIAWTLMAPLGKLAHQATLKAVFHPEAPSPEFDIAGGGVLGLRPGSFVAASSDMMMLPDELEQMVPRYPSLSMPVEVVFGRQDPICPYQVHGVRLAAAVPNAHLHVIEGGHMIPVTAADEIIQRIRHALVSA